MPTDPGSAGDAPGVKSIQPAGWTGQRYSGWNTISLALLAAFALLGILGAALALGSGELVVGLAMGAGVLYLGHIAGLGLSARWAPPRTRHPARLASPDDGHTGITFRYSAWAYYWLVATLTLTILGLVTVATISAATATGEGLVIAAILAVLAVVVAWFLITVLRLAPGVISLSPEGVFHRSLTFTHFVPWFAVFEVAAEWAGAPLIAVKAFPSDGTRLRRYTGRFSTQEAQLLPYLAVRTPWLGADPAVVYRTLAFYHTHPDRRAELTSDTALTRINSSNFGTSSEAR